MRETQSSNVPITLGVVVPATADGSRLRDLIPETVRARPIAAIEIDGNEPGPMGRERGALLVASPRPGAERATADDFEQHGKYRGAGEAWYEPSDRSLDLFLKPTGAAPVPALLTIY